jgi:hypothetical protein
MHKRAAERKMAAAVIRAEAAASGTFLGRAGTGLHTISAIDCVQMARRTCCNVHWREARWAS